MMGQSSRLARCISALPARPKLSLECARYDRRKWNCAVGLKENSEGMLFSNGARALSSQSFYLPETRGENKLPSFSDADRS